MKQVSEYESSCLRDETERLRDEVARVRPAPRTKEPTGPRRILLDDLAAILTEHEAVAQAAVLGSEGVAAADDVDRAGKRHLAQARHEGFGMLARTFDRALGRQDRQNPAGQPGGARGRARRGQGGR